MRAFAPPNTAKPGAAVSKCGRDAYGEVGAILVQKEVHIMNGFFGGGGCGCDNIILLLLLLSCCNGNGMGCICDMLPLLLILCCCGGGNLCGNNCCK